MTKRKLQYEVNHLSSESAHLLVERLAASGTTPSGRLQQREVGQRIEQALRELSESDREVLVLRFLEELSTQETADVLGVSESAVKMRVLRALQRVRADWDQSESGGSS